MTRPLRIDVEDGWYHVTARGIERKTIFCDDRHCEYFLELLDAMTERFNLVMHAYVLMGNHYNLIFQTPDANASAAMQWRKGSYSAWFNVKNDRAGHLFQGRFGSRLIDGEGSWALQASVYVHLNPVRVIGLDKHSNSAESVGLQKPDKKEVKRRLKVLSQHKWSSYPAYAGYRKKPSWLTTSSILGRAGGKVKYRKYIQSHVTRGKDPKEYSTLKDRLLIGSAGFIEKMKELIGPVTKEQSGRRLLTKRVSLDNIVKVVEEVKGEDWDSFSNQYGDWGRPCVLYLARKRRGCTLREIGDWLGGVDYKTVSKTVERFRVRMDADNKLVKIVKRCIHEMSLVET